MCYDFNKYKQKFPISKGTKEDYERVKKVFEKNKNDYGKERIKNYEKLLKNWGKKFKKC